MRALGLAFLHWAIHRPTHFKVISDRSLLIEFEGSTELRSISAEVQGQLTALLVAAREAGQLRDADLQDLRLGARAMIYGLARMYVDGQLPQWGVGEGQAEARMTAAMDHYLAGLARAPVSARRGLEPAGMLGRPRHGRRGTFDEANDQQDRPRRPQARRPRRNLRAADAKSEPPKTRQKS